MRKLMILAATAFAMAAAPTIASAQQAAPKRAAATEVQPAGEQVDGSDLRGKGYILPVIIVIGIIAALYLLIDDNDGEAFPVSP